MDALALARNGGTSLTVRDAVAPIFRQRRIASIVFLGVFTGALAWAGLAPRKYEAELKILVNRGRVESAVTSNADARPMALQSAFITEEELNSEVELLKSRDLLAQVVTACGLDACSAGSAQQAIAPSNPALSGAPARDKPLARAVQRLGQQLVVEPLKKTSVIRVSYSSSDAELSARVLQTLGALYQQKHAAVHRAPGTFSFFDREAERYKNELSAYRARLASFSAKKGLIDPAIQKQLALQQISQLETELARDRAGISAAEQTAADLRAQESASPERQTTIVRKSDNPQLLAQLTNTLLSLELKRREMLVKYAPDYPLVQQVDIQIADARKALADAQARPIEEITTDRAPVRDWMATEMTKSEAESASLKARVNVIGDAVRQSQAVARDIDREMMTQSELMRDMKIAEDNYLLYVKKREEARISDLLDQHGIVNASILEQASVPAFPKSNLGWVLVSGFLGAAVLSLGAAYVMDRMDPLFRSPDDVTRYLDVKVLAAIPLERARTNGRGMLSPGTTAVNGSQ